MKLILWPFIALLHLVTAIIAFTGRLVAVILGVIFLILGFLLCVTIVGAILGIPLILLGFMLIIRGIF